MGKHRLTYNPFVMLVVSLQQILQLQLVRLYVVRKHDPILLEENNSPLQLTSNWAKSLLYRMGFVKQKGCYTKS